MKDVNNGILVLDEYMPYNEAVFSVENHGIKIVIFPSNRGGFNIKPIQKIECFLRENNEELQENALSVTREDTYTDHFVSLNDIGSID